MGTMKDGVVPTSAVMESNLFSIFPCQERVTSLLSRIIPLTALCWSSGCPALLQDMAFGQRANCELFNTSHLRLSVSLMLTFSSICLTLNFYIRYTNILRSLEWSVWPSGNLCSYVYHSKTVSLLTLVFKSYLGDIKPCQWRSVALMEYSQQV